MGIVIFHYHLNPGGVTRIIESQVAGIKAVSSETEVKILTGYCENPEYYDSLGVNVYLNSKLNYLVDKEFAEGELEILKSEIKSWVGNLIKPGDVLHLHNLNLGKNPVATIVFSELNKEGYTILNHAHDFSEDRPVNQAFMQRLIEQEFGLNFKEIMYPDRKNYLVGVLNRTDYDRMINMGFKKERLFLFPNPVHVPVTEEPDKTKNRQHIIETFNLDLNKFIITYPVRVIRRKNIGELILLSVLFNKTCQFLVTMAPRNPVEIEYYNEWKTFCNQNNINLIFEAGLKIGFIDLLSGSDYCITTSIQEGFGMTYLEPWLIGTPVIGRNLPYVTEDIKGEGVTLRYLYDALEVIKGNNKVDFKDLNYDEQRILILDCIKSDDLCADIIALNRVFDNFPSEITTDEVEQNKQVIITNFSINNYAQRIFKAYRTVSE